MKIIWQIQLYDIAKAKTINRTVIFVPRNRDFPMWLFTKHGFFSAVCARQGDGKHGQPVDPNRIMVRARVRKHLEALQERFSDLLGKSEVQENKGTDYAFRFFVDKPVWSQVLVGLSEELDYDNFKSEVTRQKGSDGYLDSLQEVWSVMHRLQG